MSFYVDMGGTMVTYINSILYRLGYYVSVFFYVPNNEIYVCIHNLIAYVLDQDRDFKN